MEELVKILKALSDPGRIRIIKMLEVRSLCVCEISFVLGLANSTVSQHLSILKDAGIITDEKDGKWVNYHIAKGADETISKLKPFLDKSLENNSIIKADLNKIFKADRNQLCR